MLGCYFTRHLTCIRNKWFHTPISSLDCACVVRLTSGRTLYPNRTKPTQTDLNQPKRPIYINYIQLSDFICAIVVQYAIFYHFCPKMVQNSGLKYTILPEYNTQPGID